MTLASTTIIKSTRRTDRPINIKDARIYKLQVSLRSIPERAENLADRGFIQGKSWSLAQISEHLVLSSEIRYTPECEDSGK